MCIFDGEKTLVNHEIPEGIWSIPPNWNLVSLLGGAYRYKGFGSSVPKPSFFL